MNLTSETLNQIDKAIEEARIKEKASTSPFLYKESIERLTKLKNITSLNDIKQIESNINSLGQFAVKVVELFDWDYSEVLCKITSHSRKDLGIKSLI